MCGLDVSVTWREFVFGAVVIKASGVFFTVLSGDDSVCAGCLAWGDDDAFLVGVFACGDELRGCCGFEPVLRAFIKEAYHLFFVVSPGWYDSAVAWHLA